MVLTRCLSQQNCILIKGVPPAVLAFYCCNLDLDPMTLTQKLGRKMYLLAKHEKKNFLDQGFTKLLRRLHANLHRPTCVHSQANCCMQVCWWRTTHGQIPGVFDVFTELLNTTISLKSFTTSYSYPYKRPNRGKHVTSLGRKQFKSVMLHIPCGRGLNLIKSA